MFVDTVLAFAALTWLSGSFATVEAEDEAPRLQIDQSVEGVLGDSASVVQTEALRADDVQAAGVRFQIELGAPGSVTIDLRSYYFDAYLVLRDEQGVVISEDDDGLIDTHSRIVTSNLGGSRTYLLDVCALHGKGGPFLLKVSRGVPEEPSPLERSALELEDAERRVALFSFEERPPSEVEARAERLATALCTLATVHYRLGNYGEVEARFARALTIREDVLGPTHPDTVLVQGNLATLFLSLGEYDKARPLYEKVLRTQEQVLGADHPGTAAALVKLGSLFHSEGDLAAALPLYERALAIQEKALDPNDPDTATTLNNLGVLHNSRGELSEARKRFERALEIREEAYGPRHPETGTALLNLGSTLEAVGELAVARGLIERGLRVYEESLGPDHPETAGALNHLAELLRHLGDFEAAEPLYEKALANRQRAFGDDHPKTAESLINLGQLKESLGDLKSARPLMERALAINEAAFGPVHRETALCLNNLGLLLESEGDFVAARPMLERALSIQEAIQGEDHPETASYLSNLGRLLGDYGDVEEALRLTRRALAIREATLGPNHLSTAVALNNLAALFLSQGRLEDALPLYERALAIHVEVLTPNHPESARCMSNLGSLLLEMGDTSGAKPLFLHAVEVLEETLGKKHPGTAAALVGLADSHASDGESGAAEALFERATAIYESSLGTAHPETATCIGKLALLLTDRGEVTEAWRLVEQARRGRHGRVESTLGSLSEGDRYPYLAGLLWQLELQLSLSRHLEKQEGESVAAGASAPGLLAYDVLLEWKGRIGRLLTSSREQLLAKMGQAERLLVEELRACQAALSRRAMETNVVDHGVHDQALADLRQERGRIERELLRLGDVASGPRPATFGEIRTALPADSAFVDFFAHRSFVPGQSDGLDWGPRHISVWITRPGFDAPVRIDLGDAAELERSIAAFLGNMIAGRASGAGGEGLGGIRGRPPVVVEEQDRALDLRRELWDPIAPFLKGVNTVFISPDGALGTIPFETIPLDDGRFAIERFRFVYVHDPRALMRTGRRASPQDTLLAVGGVDFQAARAETPEGGVPATPSVPVPAVGLRGANGRQWENLPATRAESERVFAMHREVFRDRGRRTLLQGRDPTEARLKRDLPLYSVLHLATHGYSQEEGARSTWQEAKSAQSRPDQSERSAAIGKHPGLLSGLICAGVNQDEESAAEDGYLTAEEVGWLDLSGVELVVLSACETGLGKPQSGEGLIGLRSAFQTAGAKTVVSSLWSVMDDSTGELMSDFFENLWLNGMSRHDALREAQLAMLERNRKRRGDAQPFTWGAFVLSGEWR